MNKPSSTKTIILSGGGTLGSVMPLLALADDLRADYHLVFVGTANGVEKDFVSEAGLPFLSMAAGKWRRYWSWRNLTDLFLFVVGLVQGWLILKKTKPSLVISAGSFASVPLAVAAWCRRTPLLIHQLDYVPGLANKLMSPLARRITVSFKKSVKDYGHKAVWVGSPVRRRLLTVKAGPTAVAKHFGLTAGGPVILVLGGGTGAVGLNRLITDNLYNLTQLAQIIHLTGAGKEINLDHSSAYHQFAVLSQPEMVLAYQAADLIISRAGMSTLAELAWLGKAAVIIPMPDSHQEANAKVLAEAKAALVLNQKKLSSLELYHKIKELLADEAKRQSLGENLRQVFKPNANEEMVKIIKELVG